MKALSYRDVRLTNGLLGRRQRTNAAATLPIEYQQCKATGRIDAWRLVTDPSRTGIPTPHKFWDSDVAKWVEAAAYSLAINPDPGLERKVDDFIDLLEKAQQPDGYLNLHFTVNAPEKRWTNLRDDHELYCAGHLIEAAVAYFEATGKRQLLDIMCRYADYIVQVFGRAEGQIRGYDGHPEIELALVRLYRATGKHTYLDLARFFIDERGRQPHFFDIEAKARHENPDDGRWTKGNYRYYQAHLPLKEQTTAEGHAVRWGYLFAGAVDVAHETGDKQLLNAARKIFDNAIGKRMYVHGGIGSQHHGERFTFDYDLGNEDAYAETCAQISLMFLAHRLLHAERQPNARYADLLEHCLYNSVLSGVSLDGKRFYYENYLASYPGWHALAHRNPPERQEWFGCACCPPNVARLLASLGGYIYSSDQNTAWLHLYTSSTASLTIQNTTINLEQKTDYPWDGDIEMRISPERPVAFKLALRKPGWSDRMAIRLNSKPIAAETKNGYIIIERTWLPTDVLRIEMPMQPRRVYAHPKVRHDVGRVAIMRGPILYCLEQIDNGRDLNALALPRKAQLTAKQERRLLGGVTTITAKGQRLASRTNDLYTTKPPSSKPATLKFIPYHTWANRKPGEMIVWLREP